MIKEKSQLLKLNLSKKDSHFELKNSLYESFYSLYSLILEDPIENFWFELFHILFGYLQLIAYLFDSIVNIKFLMITLL